MSYLSSAAGKPRDFAGLVAELKEELPSARGQTRSVFVCGESIDLPDNRLAVGPTLRDDCIFLTWDMWGRGDHGVILYADGTWERWFGGGDICSDDVPR